MPLAPHPAATGGPPVEWRGLARILAVRLDNLGDVVQTTPALRALAQAAPQARLDLLASPAGASLAGLLPGVDRVLAHRASWQDASATVPDPAAELALVARLRGYDALVAFTSFSQSPWPVAYAASLAGVGVRVGTSREFGGTLLSHWVLPGGDDETVHQVDRMLRQLRAVGVPDAGTRLELRLPNGREPGVAGIPFGAPYVVLAPGASAPARRWPAPGFADVARRLLAAGMAVAVVGTAREAPLVDAVVAGAPGALGLAGRHSVPDLAAAVAGARAVLTNNSGCLHLADALGTPVVALFAGTEHESQYAPRGVPARLFRRPTDCAPCRAFRCPFLRDGLQPCLDVAPREVAGAVLDLASAGRRAAA